MPDMILLRKDNEKNYENVYENEYNKKGYVG